MNRTAEGEEDVAVEFERTDGDVGVGCREAEAG